MNILLYYVIILIREYKFIFTRYRGNSGTPIPIFLSAGAYCECARSLETLHIRCVLGEKLLISACFLSGTVV